ncbi:SRPBCC domain-containing protein [Bdellovibrio sp. KM01]|uniref:SRPBCC family protein n=1 Tax=Bdellovibrio sp. KM01 TaxID=2748865 RepID=UPI0015EA0CBA|nr:SRPBCC domain-containing protein [Bdellovibrio sp. KM01]QLY26693.1 SRPBCC domain-containing protein [Bdellovibrio sp. KM01]
MQISQQKSNSPSVHKHSTPQSRLLMLDRAFDVPVAELFKAFSTSEALKAWWWPQGLYADRVDIDFRVGGRVFINMKGYEKGGGGMTSTYEEIVENKRIVMTDQFADETGKAITPQEAQMPGEWPEMGYITLEFLAEGADDSRLALYQEGMPNELQEDCVQGWMQSFDKLEKFLHEKKH